MDVNSLYTNIPIEAGIGCVRKIFEKFPDPRRPDDELLQLLRIHLCRNDFIFNGKYYLQIKGTAMGKRFAPSYANIFMADWEDGALSKCNLKPAQYIRYLDDIFGIWTGSEEQFSRFVETLNSHDPSIKLKMELNAQSIDFLDTTVFKGPDFWTNGKLDVKVHFKSTDTHALLFKTSFHPKHTFRGIVKSQLLRFKRICTREEHFKLAVNMLFRALRRRRYSRSFLRNCFKTFQERKDEEGGDLLPLISTYSSVSKMVNKHLKTNFESVFKETDVLPPTKVISAYRRNKNLRDFLVHASLPSLRPETSQLLENHFTRLRFVKNVQHNTVHKIQQGFSPKSNNCVYVLYCVTWRSICWGNQEYLVHTDGPT